MGIAVAVIASLFFIGWIIYRILKRHSLKAHVVMYGLSCVAGAYTFAFFLSLDLPQLVKILVSILLGISLTILAGMLQRRKTDKSE